MQHLPTRNVRIVFLALIAICLAAIAMFAAWVAGLGKGEINHFVNNVVYNVAMVIPAVICLLRAAVVRADRWIWGLIGVGLACSAIGDLYWTLEITGMKKIPYPSLADFFYLVGYPFLYVGLLMLVRQRVRFSGAAWLDGAVGALAGAALATAVLAPALDGLGRGRPIAVAVNLAYPLADVLLLSLLIAGFAVLGVRAGRTWGLLTAGLAIWAVADGIYLYQEATTGYSGGYLDTMWPLGGLVMALAAVFAVPQQRPAVEAHSVVMPILFAFIAIGVVAWDHFERVSDYTLWLAIATLAGVAVRLSFSFRENAGLLKAVHQEAVTDALTGLGNRRQVLVDLQDATTGTRGEVVFAMFDLDGFKTYNDGFGHPAGDLLLRRLGQELDRAVGPDGIAYRLGGDEFCVLVPGGEDRLDQVVAVAREALSERGEGFSITASAGGAVLPAEAETTSEALRLADMRMYSAKGQRANSAQRQTHDVLVRVLREREPELSDHLHGTTRLSLEMGRRLHLDPEQIDVLQRAAELHDVGKIAIPDRVLHEPGPLSAADWELMRSHTTIGERILSAAPAMAPVARLVRSTHERWDGAGYPDGLARERIPLGSRIIFVCDAFEAMTGDRPYRKARSRAEALAELRRCAGTQFDPDLVELFAEHVYPLVAAGQPLPSSSSTFSYDAAR